MEENQNSSKKYIVLIIMIIIIVVSVVLGYQQKDKKANTNTNSTDIVIENSTKTEWDEKYKKATLKETEEIGDSTEFVGIETKYNQYEEFEEDRKLEKYTEKILYKIATFYEDFYARLVNEDNSEEGLKALEQKITMYYNSSLEEKTKFQAENLEKVSNLDSPNGWTDLKGKEYYYQISNITIMNGNNNSEEDYINNARAKKIKVTINSEKEYIYDLKDTNKPQIFDIKYKQKTIEKPVVLEIEILEEYAGKKTNDAYISDIKCEIESNIPQGR